MGRSDDLALISLFTGAGGLDLGLEQSGFSTRVVVEFDKWAQATLNANREFFGDANFPILGDITSEHNNPHEILRAAGLEQRQAFLISGGPPCQSFSTAGRRGSLGDPRGGLFAHFVANVAVAQPRFFVMENVRGILSAAIRHRPLSQRGDGHAPLENDEQQGSAFKVILSEFQRLNYQTVVGLVDAADYGTPQHRLRVIILGSRDWEFPSTHLDDIVIPTHKENWRTLRDAIAHLQGAPMEFLRYSSDREKVMKLVPQGENWRWFRDHPDYGPEFTQDIMGGAWTSGGGRVGFFRRLSWDRPSPTLPTSPIQKSTSLCHPEETRPLSVEEYAKIQEFPTGYLFSGGTSAKYKQIGNAVPVGLGRAIGAALIKFADVNSPTRQPENAMFASLPLFRYSEPVYGGSSKKGWS